MNKNSNNKIHYIPYMCDHSYVLEAASAHCGMIIKTLPPPDEETIDFDLPGVTGRECLPCFVTTNDILRQAKQPDFEPANSVFLMPRANGPCRFGQYVSLQRDILDDHGLQDMEIAVSCAGNSYQGFGDDPTKLRKLIWDGGLAVDMLQKLLHEYRPYEIHKGQADKIYHVGLDKIVQSTREGGGKQLYHAVKWIVKEFENLLVDRSEPRPIIGVIGEIYLRLNHHANQSIVRQVEDAGGEVRLASLMEWFYYTTWDYKELTKVRGEYFEFFVTKLTDMYQHYREHVVVKPAAHLLKQPYETPIADLVKNVRSYYDSALGTEALLSIGKSVDLATHGASGILNVMPFSCMAGIIAAGVGQRLRRDYKDIPWLDVIFESKGNTNITTRLEAFLYQATQYHRRIVLE